MRDITRHTNRYFGLTTDDVVRLAKLSRGCSAFDCDTHEWARWAMRFLRGLDRTAQSARDAEKSAEYVAEPILRESLSAACRAVYMQGAGIDSEWAIYDAAKSAVRAAKASNIPVTV